MKYWKVNGLVLCVIVLVLGCSGDNGVNPPSANQVRIVSITPSTVGLGARGSRLIIAGSGFAGGATVDLGPGIDVVSVEIPSSVEIDVTVNVGQAAAAGTRTVVVAVGAQTGQLTEGLTISDNHAPIAAFTVSPNQGTISTTFQFDASDSNDADGRIAAYQWEFSDGSTGHGIRLTKQFKEKGSYTARLTVLDDTKNSSSLQKKLVIGDNEPPVATFTISPSTGTNLTSFTFDATGSVDPDGNIAGYKWTFTQNGTANGPRLDRKFQNVGDIVVELEVRDNKGAVSIARKTVNVHFFDVDEAKKEITDVLVTFLKLFGELENRSADDIVIGFSRNCNGRNREIGIIKTEQAVIKQSGVVILGDPAISNVTESNANAAITAEFHGVYFDGNSYSGVATHHMTMVTENGQWLICDFSVTVNSMVVASPMAAH